MSNGVSISDMHDFVGNMGSDIQISSNVGNVIELDSGIEDLGDDLGIGLLSVQNTSRSRQGPVSSSNDMGNSINVNRSNDFEPLEAISFDIPESSGMDNIEVSVNRNSSNDGFNLFENKQTASGPSINLASSTRLTAEEERKKKSDLLNKLGRLEAKGYTLTKRFTMDNTLEEVQNEYDRLVDAKSLEASLRFQRQMLMGVVTGAEFLNSKFNPFDWELDGWSESVHENVEDFDEIFEELYDKYKGRGSMPPEARLAMSLVGSGFMFHMSNSFFKSKVNNFDPNEILKNNPQLAKQFAMAAAQQAGPGFGNFMGSAMGVEVPPQRPQQQTGQFYQSPQQTQQDQFQHPSQPVPPPVRREMKGPSGVDDILKTFQEVRASEMEMPQIFVPPQPIYNQPAKQASSELASIHSTPMSSMSEGPRSINGGERRGRRKAVVPVENTMTLNL
jgi:hypothetical protein